MDVMRRLCKGPELKKDKGFVWLILVMSFLSHGLHLGFTYAVLGNLTIAHQKFFNIDLEQSTLIGSVHGGVLFIFGKCLLQSIQIHVGKNVFIALCVSSTRKLIALLMGILL